MNNLALEQKWVLGGSWAFPDSLTPEPLITEEAVGLIWDWWVPIPLPQSHLGGVNVWSSFSEHTTVLWGSLRVEKGCLYKELWFHTWALSLAQRPLRGLRLFPHPRAFLWKHMGLWSQLQRQRNKLDSRFRVCSHCLRYLFSQPAISPLLLSCSETGGFC